MRTLSRSLPLFIFVSVLVAPLACGGGGDGEDGPGACSVLKIAGGEECGVKYRVLFRSIRDYETCFDGCSLYSAGW
jgi:hypothetical protein